MRTILLIFYSILLTSQCISQVQTNPLSSKDSIRVSLKKMVSDKFPGIALKNVVVFDARPETGSVGYSNLDYQIVQKYFFKSTAEKELSDWFNNYLQTNQQDKNGLTLLINIKKLRVSKNVFLQKSLQSRDTLIKKSIGQGVVEKIEFFLQQDSFFIPLYRFDSAISITGKLPKDAGSFITTALTLSVASFLNMTSGIKPANKRKLLLEDIVRSNNQINDLPVNKETTLKRGIYKTFEEFKMNTPSITEYELRKGSSGAVFINENGSLYEVKDIWGFCDGNDYYIRAGNSYSKLIRTENSFYFSGRKITAVKPDKVNPELLNFGFSILDMGLFGGNFDPTTKYYSDKPAYDVVQRHYQLDMETGEFY